MALSADDLLKLADDIEIKEVDIPGKGSVFVRGMTGIERERWQASNQTWRPRIGGGTDLIPQIVGSDARLLVKALCDESGTRLFTDDQEHLVGALPSAVMSRLADAARKISAIDDESEQEAEGNSDAAPSGDSTSSSPENSDLPSPIS